MNCVTTPRSPTREAGAAGRVAGEPALGRSGPAGGPGRGDGRAGRAVTGSADGAPAAVGEDVRRSEGATSGSSEPALSGPAGGPGSGDQERPEGGPGRRGGDPGRVPSPPAPQDHRGWARALGGVDGCGMLLELTATGKSADSVVISDVHVRVVRRAGALPWPAYSMGEGCGSGVTPQTFAVDLDRAQPAVVPVARQSGDAVVPARDFPYKVASDDPRQGPRARLLGGGSRTRGRGGAAGFRGARGSGCPAAPCPCAGSGR